MVHVLYFHMTSKANRCERALLADSSTCCAHVLFVTARTDPVQEMSFLPYSVRHGVHAALAMKFFKMLFMFSGEASFPFGLKT